jgi:hypothetical protein
MRSFVVSCLLLVGLAACSGEPEPATPPPAVPVMPTAPPPSGSDPAAIVAAANAFLSVLTADERNDVLFDRGDKEQQQRWSNLPHGIYDRAGLMVGDLEQSKVTAFLTLMRTTLSTKGFERVMGAWAADDVIAASDGRTNLGTRYYWIAIIGEPSATEPWQWQFGGHHLSVNATLRGDALSLTPSFVGAQPATYRADGTEVRPLGAISDEAFALVNMLDGGGRQRAVLGARPIDVVLGAGQDCRTVPAEGLPGSAMTDGQRDAFLRLVNEYGGLGNDRMAATRLAQLKADLPETYFAWYGPTTPGSAAYFRITGPHIVVEYSPQSMGGDAESHIHGIYRDPTNDYGGTVCS